MDQRIYNSNAMFVQLGPTYLTLDIINLQIYCTSLPTSFLAKLLFFKECVLLHLYYGWIFNYHMSFESFPCFTRSRIHNLPSIPFIIIFLKMAPRFISFFSIFDKNNTQHIKMKYVVYFSSKGKYIHSKQLT
jgi:hypothetical protein